MLGMDLHLLDLVFELEVLAVVAVALAAVLSALLWGASRVIQTDNSKLDCLFQVYSMASEVDDRNLLIASMCRTVVRQSIRNSFCARTKVVSLPPRVHAALVTSAVTTE